MLHDSVLGVELLLRQFQNIFAWWIKWKKLDNLSCVKLWNLDSLLWKKFSQIVCVNEMTKFGSLLFMCEHIWTYWTNFRINWTGFLNRFWVNKLNRFFLWNFYEIWTDIVDFFLSRLNKFCVNRLNIFFLWSFCEFWTNFVAIFWINWTYFVSVFWTDWTDFV